MQRLAAMNALERMASDQGPERLQAFDRNRDLIAEAMGDIVLTTTELFRSVDPATRTIEIGVRAEVNVTRLTTTLQSGSTEREAEPLGIFLMARRAPGATTTKPQTQSTTDLDGVLGQRLQVAGYRAYEAAFFDDEVSPSVVEAVQTDFGDGDDLRPQTLRRMMAVASEHEVRYVLVGTLENGGVGVDEASGLQRMYVSVTAKVYDVSGRLPRTIVNVGPAQYRGLGPTQDVARVNALKGAGDAVARTVIDALSNLSAGPRVAQGSGSSSGARPGGRAVITESLREVPLTVRPNPDALAVIIGNRNYRNAPAVAFATNDAAAMRLYAERALGIQPGNILLLEDASLSDLKRMFGERGNPNGRLKQLVREGQSEVFIFYSGHGAPDPATQGAYLMPVDADANALPLTGMSVETLYENLGALGAKHVTVVLDACFSGATGDGEMLITSASPIGIAVNDPSARIGRGNATIVAAAQGQQLANWFPAMRHGMLTYFFLKGLQGSADANGDGQVSVEEMRSWLTTPTSGLPYEARRLHGREQTPQVFGLGGHILRP